MLAKDAILKNRVKLTDKWIKEVVLHENTLDCETVPFDEIAHRLNISRATAYKAAKCGDLLAIKVSRRLVVLREPFERLLRDGNVSGSSGEDRPAQ